MGTKIMKQKETETVFDRRNYVILLIGSVMIIVGYLFMSGEGSTPAAYNPDIFSGLRIGLWRSSSLPCAILSG